MPKKKYTKSHVRYEPTPEEIREVCAEIREGWDAHRIARQPESIDWELIIVKAPDGLD